jgi:hypothetical protein
MMIESASGGHYDSPRLHGQGKAAWVALFDTAIKSHNDDWLAHEIIARRMLSTQEQYIRGGKTFWRNVNVQSAAQMLAEGEFNRYYLRGLCVRAAEDGISHLIVYRGRASSSPRPESEAKIGMRVPVGQLLETLRRKDFVSLEKDVLAIPSGPNSGLTACLP